MERSPRLRGVGDSMLVGSSTPASPENRNGDHVSLVHHGTRAADHARGQVQEALDGLLGDDQHLAPPSPSGDEPVVHSARSPGRGRRPFQNTNSEDSTIIGATHAQRNQQLPEALSPGRRSTGVEPDSEGFTPSAAGGKPTRRRSSVRSPKRYRTSTSQGQAISISTLEELKLFLEGKQSEVEKAHSRRTKELETTMEKERTYLHALLSNQLESHGVRVKATSDMLNGKPTAKNLFRRGSRRLSSQAIDEALNSEHAEEMKKADHLRKKLLAYHDEARTVLAKRLQVESSRMSRVIKTNLTKYANPKLPQSAKTAVLASVVEYLNGEEFDRIVSATHTYKSPDFVRALEMEQGIMAVTYSLTNQKKRGSASLVSTEAIDFDQKIARLQEQKRIEQQQKMAAIRQNEALEREKKAVIEKEAAEAIARTNEENLRRQEQIQKQQEEELEAKKRQLVEHQVHLKKEAERVRERHRAELELRRVEIEKQGVALLAQQAEAKRLQEEDLEKQRMEIQRQHDEDMERQRQEIARHGEEAARHAAELSRRKEEFRLEQEALEDMKRRVREEEEDERRRLQEEVAQHKEQAMIEAERMKMEVEALNLEREKTARAEEAERAREEQTPLEGAKAASDALAIEREEEQRKAADAAAKAQKEADIEAMVAQKIQAERERVAAEAAFLEAKIKEFEKEREEAAAKADADLKAERVAAAKAAADKEAALAAREQEAAKSLALARALSEGVRAEKYCVGDKVHAWLNSVDAPEGTKAFTPGEVARVNSDGSLDIALPDGRMIQKLLSTEVRRNSSQGSTNLHDKPGSWGYSVGDKVDTLCTPVGAPVGTKAYILGEVALVNPDGSLDIALADGRMKQQVPLTEIKFSQRTPAPYQSLRPPSAGPTRASLTPDSGDRCDSESEAVDPARMAEAESQARWRANTETGENENNSVSNLQNWVEHGSLDDMLSNKLRAASVEKLSQKEREELDIARDTTINEESGTDSGKSGGLMQKQSRRSLDDILRAKGSNMAKGVPKGTTRVILQDGDIVEALTEHPESGSRRSAFSPGVICRVYENGSVDVNLDSGDKLVHRPPQEVRAVGRRVSSVPPHSSASKDFAVGDRVEARYGSKADYLPGVVTSTEDGVSINFDAGWHGASIPVEHVRPVSTDAGTSLPNPKGFSPEVSAVSKMRSTGSIVDLDVGSLGGDTFSEGDQVKVREKKSLRAGPPKTLKGVIRSVHPNGLYQVGLDDGSLRDQVGGSCLTGFEWTITGTEAYRLAAYGDGNGPTTERAVEAGGGKPKGPAPNGCEKAGLDSGGRNRQRLSKSLRDTLFDKFGPPGSVLPESAIGIIEGGTRRRATHAGSTRSAKPELRVNIMHFTPQEFMDPDTAAQTVLTPNNAGMFKPVARQGQGRRQLPPKLSSHSTVGGSHPDGGEVARAAQKQESRERMGSKPLHNLPRRRMTFGGFRSDKKGAVYQAQRRPSFLDSVVKKAVGAAEIAVKATRRLSIQSNNGEGFELVAIGDRKATAKNGRRQSASKAEAGGDDDGEESHDSLWENQTHFYRRSRHVFEPQHTEMAPSTWWIRTCSVINLICMAVYLWWRCIRSLDGVPHIIWGYMFLVAECIMAIGMIVGHSSRSFPVHREKVYMDDLTDADEAVGALKVAVLVPTCGEKTAVMLRALFGNLQLRLWKSKNARRETLRIVVLDEKNREEVQKLVSLVYTLAEVVLDKIVREILMREGVVPISAKGFYDHFADGAHGQRVYDDVNFIRGIEIVTEIDKLILANDDSFSRFSPSVAISKIKERARRASCFERKEIQPGQKKVWNRNKYIPTIVYYSRIDAGQPRISPKAGNMNRAIFSFNPRDEPLIGEAAVVVVNDVRHELYPEFLQRTVPYFFTFDNKRRCYKWADIAFIQTPQRFRDRTDWNDPDPLGNQAATQFDIVNSGRDGAGGALSCGQGSVWRVQVLRDGIRPDGSRFAKKELPEDQVGRQGGLGFRAEVLIEDTHTSIDLFREGWKSVYVNFPKETLACCTLPPDTVKWRWKQVLRWHQGAVQLAMWKGWGYAMTGDTWGTLFQKVFAFDAISYFLQAFAGEILLVFPVVYGFTNSAPFNTWNIEFALYFFPFIITGVLPTVAALGWQRTPSAKVMRDEQIWFSTSFVQIYAVMHAVWGTITRKDPSNAWNIKCPVWPLYFHFVVIIVALVFNTSGWISRGYEEPWVWVSCVGSSLFALHSLWPVVSFGLGVTMPEAFYTRVFGMLVVMTLVSMWLLGEAS